MLTAYLEDIFLQKEKEKNSCRMVIISLIAYLPINYLLKINLKN